MADNVQLFIDEWNGKFIDFDYVYGNQCKDLIQKYVTECLALPPLPQGNACDMWTNYQKDLYTRYYNFPWAIPKKGDIMIWGPWVGNPYGHISIYVDGTMWNFRSFDQNFAIGSPCHYQAHSYLRPFVKGWLRKK